MTVSTTLTDQRGFMKIAIAGVASAANAGIGEIINPEGVRLGITRTYAYFATGSTGAANFDVGVGVSGAKATDILSTFDCIEATVGAKLFSCQAAGASETEEAVIWEIGEYITFTGSATTVGLAGDLYIEYIRLA